MNHQNEFYTSTICHNSEKAANCAVFSVLLLLAYLISAKVTYIPNAIGLTTIVLFALIPIWGAVRILTNQFFGKELIICSDKLVYNNKTYVYSMISKLDSNEKTVKFYSNKHNEDVNLNLNAKDAYKLTTNIEFYKV